MIIIPRSIGPVPVDAVIKEMIESTLKITQRPVEFGADVTDHAYVEPKRIVIEGVIGGSLDRPSSGRLAATIGWQALKRLQETREPFTLVSGLDVHRNILIEKLTADRDKDWSRVLKFTAECREIIIVGSAYIPGPAQSAPAGGQARSIESSALAPGAAGQRAAPDVLRGDQAIVDAPMSSGTAAGRANSSIAAQILGLDNAAQ